MATVQIFHHSCRSFIETYRIAIAYRYTILSEHMYFGLLAPFCQAGSPMDAYMNVLLEYT